MATLTLRVDDAIREELDRAARARGTTVSELLRSAINDLLGFEDTRDAERESRVVVPQTLDVVQRRMFAMMHEVLGKLAEDEDDEEYHRQHAAVMTEGFAGEYHAEFGFMSAELSPAECRRLNDILEMFRVLEYSLTQLTPADRERLGDDANHILIFDGFDLQKPAEARMLSYARHMVKDEDNWSEFQERLTTGERGNSHSSRLARYLRMHCTYKAIQENNQFGRGHRRDTHLFDVDDLRAVIESAWHPAER